MCKNILTIGAYERDNFGDLLFFIILKKALQGAGWNIVPGSVVYSDMRNTLGEIVFPYDILLHRYKWDAVWVVGGEMGSLDIENAMLMSLEKEHAKIYQELEVEAREYIMHFLAGNNTNHLAYLPIIDDYDLNKNTKLIINSVGGFELLDNRNTVLFDSTMKTLKSATYISVRNRQSHVFLNSHGIHNVLAPDIVHIIPLCFQDKDYDFFQQQEEDYALFQISTSYFNEYPIDYISKKIFDTIKEYDYKIYLFAAGIANYHDDIEQYKDIKKYIHCNFNEDRVEIINERNPIALVNWIKHSKLWVGSSLHGRIISSAYSIPRVSLKMDKVSNYCELWDNLFPYNVALDNIVRSCEIAWSVEKKYADFQSKSLSEKAKTNLNSILDKIYEN